MSRPKNCPNCGMQPNVQRLCDIITVVYCPRCEFGTSGYDDRDGDGETKAIDIWNLLTKDDILKGIKERKQENAFDKETKK